MTFEQHLEGVARLGGADATIPDRWYEAPAFYFTNPSPSSAHMTTCRYRAGADCSTSSWRSPR